MSDEHKVQDISKLENILSGSKLEHREYIWANSYDFTGVMQFTPVLSESKTGIKCINFYLAQIKPKKDGTGNYVKSYRFFSYAPAVIDAVLSVKNASIVSILGKMIMMKGTLCPQITEFKVMNDLGVALVTPIYEQQKH